MTPSLSPVLAEIAVSAGAVEASTPAWMTVLAFLGIAQAVMLVLIPFIRMPPHALGFRARYVVLLAQGFGSGRLRPAPGTWGSVVGVGWLVALLSLGNVWGFLAGTVAGLAVSVWACDRAGRILGEKDPGCIVIDEIAALPLAWLGVWVLQGLGRWEMLLPMDAAFWRQWPELVMAFGAFRLFDIWKPGWVGRSQDLPRGWGVTADDVLAALLAALPVAGVAWMRH